MSIIADDITPEASLSDSDAVAQLVAAMNPAKPAAAAAATPDPDDEDDEGEDAPETPDDGDETDPDDEDGDENEDEDGEGDEGEGAPDPSAAAPAPIADDAVIKVTVDGQEIETTVGGLKRLAGQEASLTRKSQEADVVGSRAAAVLHGALESVLEDLEPYKDVDWVLEGQRMDPEEFEWHRETFKRLEGRYQKLVGSAQAIGADRAQRENSASEERAAKAIAILTDPKDGIPGWNEQLYGDIMAYGVSQGLDDADVKQITDAPVLKLLHKAMLYDKGQKAAVEKVNLAPTKVRKSGGRDAVTPVPAKTQKALEQKIASGRATDDDAIAALVGRWGARAR